MSVADWLVLAGYFALVFGVAFVVTKRERKAESTEDYFLAGRNAGWFVIGASLFASNIGSEHLVGLAGTGASSGVAVAQFEIIASLVLLLLGWFFVPFYLRSGVYTMPEFLELRYAPAVRWYLAAISILAYVLTKISVTIAAGAIVFQALMGIDFWTGAVCVVVATGAYTVFGGLRAVLYTDMLQVFVLIGGSLAICFAGLVELGGWSELEAHLEPHAMSLWRPISDPNFPWTGIAVGAPILGIWYWCTDQFIVQRVLSAKNITHARRGTIFAGYLKLLPLFLFVLPGMIAGALAASGKLELDDPDKALPTLVAALLPSGLRGLVIAGLLAALMSSLSSVFNSCSTMITWDVYKKIRPDASDKRLVVVGQIATLGLVVCGLLWVPLMKNISGQLYTYLQSVQAYISPPIAAVFLIGLLWKRANAAGAIAALAAGFVLGSVRLMSELLKTDMPQTLVAFAEINFLHFAAYLFFVCVIVLVVVSLATSAQSTPRLDARNEKNPVDPSVGRMADGVLSGVLIVLVCALWLVFSG